MMKILHDRNMPLAEAFFSSLGELEAFEGRALTRASLRRADALLVRSVTPVTADLLEGSRVAFVGSATIGTDHLDLEALASAAVHVVNAPGCNADSVVDYVLAALLELAVGDWRTLARRKLGIVGLGNVGSRLQARLQALGLHPLVCDPPRAGREPEGDWWSLDALLEEVDILCLHTPLVARGPHPTHHLLGAERLSRLRQGAWLINAGRGAVVDNTALADLLSRRRDLAVVLDVWEGEPHIRRDLCRRVALATPHIAGYSLEGRCRGTQAVYQGLCAFLGVEPEIALDGLLPTGPEILLEPEVRQPLRAAVRACYDLRADDEGMRAVMAQAGSAAGFDRLRRTYPPRREFSACRLKAGPLDESTRLRLEALGFRLDVRQGEHDH